MLVQIQIANLITVHQLNLEFKTGTIVITGETGAGKSIIIDAIELALGGRAKAANIVRSGQEKADICLTFDVSKLPEAQSWLKNFDLHDSSNECIVRRTIYQDGRSRCFINGMPTTLQPLKDLSERLIQIHGQHENQSLLKNETQRTMLDQYACHQHLVDSVYTLAEEWQSIHDQIQELTKRNTDRSQRAEFLKFQLQELEALNLAKDEFVTLDLEHKQLAHAGELLQNINLALNHISDTEENSVLDRLNQTLHALESVQKIDPKISSWIEPLKNSIIQISDVEDDLRHYIDTVPTDLERLSWLEQRLSILFDTARKHRVAPNELYDLQQKIVAEYNQLENSDAQLAELVQKQQALAAQYMDKAFKLSQSRALAASKLAAEITKTIKQLSLPQAQFEIQLEISESKTIAKNGLEKIIFRIQTNVGSSLQPLAKIVSGGELSRVSLALHIATTGKHSTPTLVFDEVDVGISGGTAEIVGKLLRRLGNTHQVFCITHQPQVAALGHHHIKAEKSVKNNNTFTSLNLLSAEEKIQELARMLGGVEITKKTLAHARELAESAE